MTESINILWRRVVDGDRAAWADLVRQFAPLVMTVAVRSGLSAPDAEDCGQQVWLALYRTRKNVRDPARLPAWLIQTTRRRAVRMRQQQSARRQVEADAPEAASLCLPDDQVVQLEQAAILEGALARLEPRCRDLLRKLFFSPGGTTYAEIARHFGLSPNALGPLRSRCLARLRKILAELGYPVD
ncbi:MAG TPA: sigma-70 family RNA polymerase sigma factor [candidate division Zixibacteria bacterium]|nr:sigma-70 family RNA polymerase sigma factor [candidate division Zixibacteria bacterium]MDD4916489.1 sigma-70 family RNA polymerase sigma factor [candidate division Zixibacteria bacterium]HOD65086.1 sigma-70 family RNA polymerase sigma factor [candidate division Zixibacteria bacterium]HOZ06687.1 sigma-70 family RNA polymerase sigma factor [candidate division Zixibacteria bacterium]HPC11731.1 sigma-70 family RNA polymerase sigma factor [candidate division Zixibacteria bacterium]